MKHWYSYEIGGVAVTLLLLAWMAGKWMADNTGPDVAACRGAVAAQYTVRPTQIDSKGSGEYHFRLDNRNVYVYCAYDYNAKVVTSLTEPK